MDMQKKKQPGAEGEWVDPEEAPPLTREWFERAALYRGDKLVRPGRPKSANPKEDRGPCGWTRTYWRISRPAPDGRPA